MCGMKYSGSGKPHKYQMKSNFFFFLSELKSQIMQNPGALAAMQGHLESLVGQRSGYIERYVIKAKA